MSEFQLIRKSTADNAAKRVRQAAKQGLPPPAEALDVIDEWRGLHAEPMAYVTNSLRDRANRLQLVVPIANRLKRKPQIVAKLSRKTTRLAQMQDIGGCRAITPDLATAKGLCKRLATSTPRQTVCDIDDYMIDGRPETGYRATHTVVEVDERLVEIQVRTIRQHAWAEAVERTATLTKLPLKDGQGPDEILRLFRLASEALHQLDEGQSVARNQRRELQQLRDQLDTYLPANDHSGVFAKLPARRNLSKSTNQWLIIYNWNKARFEHWIDLGSDGDAARLTYARYEQMYPLDEGYEVVLIGADSERTIEQTHAQYFGQSMRDIDPHGIFREILPS